MNNDDLADQDHDDLLMTLLTHTMQSPLTSECIAWAGPGVPHLEKHLTARMPGSVSGFACRDEAPGCREWKIREIYFLENIRSYPAPALELDRPGPDSGPRNARRFIPEI